MNFNGMDMYFQQPKFPTDLQLNNKISNNNNDKYDKNNMTEYEINKYLYQNTRGINTPSSYLIYLDSKSVSGANVNNFEHNKVVYDLCDPIIIDSPTEIWLEYIHLQNLDVNNGTVEHLEGSAQFYIQIDELSIKNITNNQFQSNKFFIPNMSYGSTDDAPNDSDATVKTYNILPKSNFLCEIEANYIRKFTVTVSSDYGTGVEHYNLTNKNSGIGNDAFETCGAVKLCLFLKKKQ